ncbi:MAG: CxxC-x17-CxxC domain-containing protein, partial [Candidatus Paceibacterota bacterium]
PVIKAFWTDEFAKYTDRFMTEASAAIQNKVGQFVSNPLIRNIIGQTKSAFDLREIMDDKKILIMNLSKGRIGEENSRLIGAMLITKIYLAAMSRVDVAEKERSDFYLYVDEFQNFATESFKDILSEARKYRLDLILAHQYIAQMDEKVADAVFGNVGTLITFRVGAADAEFLEKEFEPEFMVQDLVNLGFAGVYLRLMIDGVPSRPFSATTLPPIKSEMESCANAIIESSREKYASSRGEVEEEIASWHAPSVSVAEKSSFDNGARPMGASRSLPHAGAFRQASSGEKDQPELFEATCSVCGKKTYVPFKPDGKRPIFCKVHRASGGGGAGEVRKEATISPAPINVNPVKTISLKDLEGGRRPASSVSRPAPKMDELRKVLDEVMAKEEEKEEAPKKNILKPGDKIKFE